MKDREQKDIAIVGISIFCPAGDSVDEFWHGIARGGDFITECPPDVIESHYFNGAPNGLDSFYCSRGGFSKAFKIDPLRYGIMPIVADGLDPDQLVSIAGAELALHDAGIFEKNISLQNCSIIIGKGNFSGLIPLRSLEIIRTARQLTTLIKSALPKLTDDDLQKVLRAYQATQGRYQADMAIGTMPNLVASLVANKFDMQGPAYTIDAACASGIVAINHSIELLRNGQCDVAVAGGMHGSHSAMFWGAFDMLGAMSRKQVIAPFSADADGLLVGQGGGFIVLKRLRNAIEDGDRIYAVIKETAVCSDGATSHVMVTSVEGQMRVLEKAWTKAGMDPERLGYIEAHGTATVVGDRTEISTLKTFFGDNTHSRAYVGSVKSNIGHTMPAAGMIGIIKTALALYNRKIPPTLHCERPMPAMFESRFLPPQELIDWDGEKIPLVAGVNAFGFGGINSHAILTAYEPTADAAPQRKPKPYLGEALAVSAADSSSLILKLEKGDYTDTGGDYRIVIFDPDENRIKQAIDIVKKDKPWRDKSDIWFTNRPILKENGKIVFLFPGFNTEYDSETKSISQSLELPYIDDLIAPYNCEAELTQKVIRAYFSDILSLSGLEQLGFKADIYAGYSIGELDAMRFAGMTEGDTFELKTKILEWKPIENYPMIAISNTNIKVIETLCEKISDVCLVSDDCPSQTIICGKESAMNILMETLEKESIDYTAMPSGAGLHTPLAAGETPFHESLLKSINVKEGHVPVWSATTLNPIPSDKEKYIELLINQMTKPIYFRNLIEKLYNEQQARIFIQIGHGNLTDFVEDSLKNQNFGAIATAIKTRSGANQLRRVMALLFIEGRKVDANFLGVKPLYQVDHSLLVLPRGIPPVMTELPALNEVIQKRYNDTDSLSDTSDESASDNSNPIAAALNENIRDAVKVQNQFKKLFEQRLDSNIKPKSKQNTASQNNIKHKATSVIDHKKGETFNEPIQLKLEDHPYLVDHSVVRQPKDWQFTEDLNPVVPFTMTIELIAEIAKKHAPGRKLIKVGNLTAYKWIALEKPIDDVVKGKWLSEDTLEIQFGSYAKAECTFGDSWTAPPSEYTNHIDLGRPIMNPPSVQELYDRFSFHGPQYHSSTNQVSICSKGMETKARKQAGKGSLLDVMGQQLGLFLHLTQETNTISFPVRLKSLTFFEDIFDQKGEFEHTLIITRLTDNAVTGDMVLKRNGKVWAVAREFVCQRFVNIISVWNVILKPQFNKLATEIYPSVFFYENNTQDNILFLLAKRYLSGPDRDGISNHANPKRQREHIVSRIALKDSVRSFVAEGDEMLYPIEFYCDHDKNGKPFVCGYGHAKDLTDGLYVSLAHKGNAAVAITSNRPVGIDLEIIEEKSENFWSSVCTEDELALMKSINDPEIGIRFWVAKEAYAKKAGGEIEGNPKRYEVKSVDGDTLTIMNDVVKVVKIGTEYIAGWTL